MGETENLWEHICLRCSHLLLWAFLIFLMSIYCDLLKSYIEKYIISLKLRFALKHRMDIMDLRENRRLRIC